jgi:predicted O-methyltransferase YrrM
MVGVLEQLRAVQARLVSSGSVVAPDGDVRDIFPVAIGPREGAALRDAIVEEGALRTFETGLGFAVSTLFICEGLLVNGPGASHVAMDPFQTTTAPGAGTTYAGVGLRTLEEAGVRSLVEFHEQESQIVLPRLVEERRTFDLAFVDGSHRFEAVFLDLIYAARLVPEGGIVFIDDTQLPAVRRSVDFCVGNLGWVRCSTGSESDAHEWTVCRTGSAARLLRPFTEFADFPTDL